MVVVNGEVVNPVSSKERDALLEVERLKEDNKALQKRVDAPIPDVCILGMDRAKVLAIGRFRPDATWTRTSVQTSLMLRALQALDHLDCRTEEYDKTEGYPEMVYIWSKPDFPVIMSTVRDCGVGVMVAPCSPPEDRRKSDGTL